jgi:MarR family transcriptional regulator, transcriptional regulator for hemolysin
MSICSIQDAADNLFYLLHDVAHLMRIRFDKRARVWGMTRAQCVILLHLRKQPGMTQNEMASLCEIEPITVARLIDRLEAGGYVERRPDPADRRINRLHLKPAADPILERILKERGYAIQYIMDGMDESVRDAAVAALKHMKQKLTTEDMSKTQQAIGE